MIIRKKHEIYFIYAKYNIKLFNIQDFIYLLTLSFFYMVELLLIKVLLIQNIHQLS